MNRLRNIITIGYVGRLLERESRDFTRMNMFAQSLDQLHMIVFTTKQKYPAGVLINNKLTVHPTQSVNRWMMIFDAVRIAVRLIRQNREKTWVISSQDPFESGLAARLASWLTGVPHHIQIHSDFYRNKHWLSKFSNRWRARFGLVLLKTCAAVRVVGEDIKKSLVVRGIVADKITTLPVYIELGPFLEVGRQRLHALVSVPRRFVFVGRFSEEKNVPLLIKAYATVARRHSDIHLTIVGDGPDRELMMTLINAEKVTDRITHIPWTNNVAETLLHQDVFLLTSYREGWPLVIMEAHAAGLPVIATDVGTITSVVHEGESGFLVPPGEVEPYVAAMERMLDPRTSYQSMARAAFSVGDKHAAWQRSYSEAWIESFARALPANTRV